MDNKQKQQVALYDVSKWHDILKSIDTALNTAALKGVYNLNDAFILKSGINTLSSVINTINTYQTEQIRIMKEQDAQKKEGEMIKKD